MGMPYGPLYINANGITVLSTELEYRVGVITPLQRSLSWLSPSSLLRRQREKWVAGWGSGVVATCRQLPSCRVSTSLSFSPAFMNLNVTVSGSRSRAHPRDLHRTKDYHNRNLLLSTPISFVCDKNSPHLRGSNCILSSERLWSAFST